MVAALVVQVQSCEMVADAGRWEDEAVRTRCWGFEVLEISGTDNLGSVAVSGKLYPAL